MVLKLYGTSFATCTKRVATTLLEKDVPFELVELNFREGEHKTPEYREIQPFGQIPYIDDDGFIVYESRAICRYIATKYADQGTKLIPTDLKELAMFEQAASVELCHFDPKTFSIVEETVYNPYWCIATDSEAVKRHVKNLEPVLDVYDKILSKQKYTAGNEFSLVDIFHLPFGSLMLIDGINLMETKPNVARWFKDITSRQSWMIASAGVKSTAPA